MQRFVKKSTSALVALSCLAAASLQAAEDDWLGLDTPEHSVAIKAGMDDQDSQLLGLEGDFTLPNYSHIRLAYHRVTFEREAGEFLNEEQANEGSTRDENADYYAIGFATDPLASWGLGLEYRQSEADSSFTTEDWQADIFYRPGNWELSLGYLIGQVSADNPLDNNTRFNFADPEFDRTGLTASLAYDWSQWQMRVSAIYYDYDEDLRDAYLDLLPGVLAEFRVFQVIAEHTLIGLFDIIDYRADWSVSYAQSAWLYQFAVSQLQYALTEEQDQTVMLGGSYAFNSNFSLGLTLSSSIEDDLLYGESSVRFYW